MLQATQVMSGDNPGFDEDGDPSQFLSFRIAGEVYAIDLLNLREIVDYGNLTLVPMMPDFIRGVINLRGSVVPVVDLAIRFGGQSANTTKWTSIIIVEVINESENEKMDIGIIVDSVDKVLDITPGDIESPPSFGAKIRTDFIKGMGKVNGKFIVLLDVGNVLSIEELSMVGEVKTRAKEPDGEYEA